MTETPVARRQPDPDRESVVAVVTTFHPEPGLALRIAAIRDVVRRVIIVDNASAHHERRELEELVRQGGLDALWNRQNLGLAAALNLGMSAAERLGAAWGLLLDQDSQAQPDIVGEAARVLEQAGPRPVAAIGAGIIGKDSGAPAGRLTWVDERAVITSGTLVSVEAWRNLGGFRPDFFVDYVDLEFCLRARACGYAIVRSKSPTIRHVIGHSTQRRMLWRTVTVTHHAPERRYSITRNRIVIWRSYLRREPAFVATDALAFLKELAKVAFLEDQRAAKGRAIVAGIVDGVRAPRIARTAMKPFSRAG